MGKALAVIDKQKNFVINLVGWDPEVQPDPSIFGNERVEYVEYDPAIHPWGQFGPLQIEVGPGWEQAFNALYPLENLNPGVSGSAE